MAGNSIILHRAPVSIKKSKATLDSVLSTVERGFADLEGKMDRGFAAVADDITDIKSKMATKEDLADLRREMATKDDIKLWVSLY